MIMIKENMKEYSNDGRVKVYLAGRSLMKNK